MEPGTLGISSMARLRRADWMRLYHTYRFCGRHHQTAYSRAHCIFIGASLTQSESSKHLLLRDV